jgi:bifunctional DNase/RNase
VTVHEMRVMAVGVEPGAYRPVLLLEEASGDHRLLPAWIGAAVANAWSNSRASRGRAP